VIIHLSSQVSVDVCKKDGLLWDLLGDVSVMSNAASALYLPDQLHSHAMAAEERYKRDPTKALASNSIQFHMLFRY